MQDRASPLIEELSNFHDFAFIIILILTIITLSLIAGFLCFSFYNKYLLHDHFIEIIWTIIPIIILLIIAFPSIHMLYLLENAINPNLTLKAIGHQWYWSYEYSDFLNVEFDSYIISDSNYNRLLNVDNRIVIPLYSHIRVITTRTDVIHAWTVPSLGVKVDAIPGHLNQLSFYINRIGIFFGQCSEICGANHRFIPIKVESTFIKEFLNWINNFFLDNLN